MGAEALKSEVYQIKALIFVLFCFLDVKAQIKMKKISLVQIYCLFGVKTARMTAVPANVTGSSLYSNNQIVLIPDGFSNMSHLIRVYSKQQLQCDSQVTCLLLLDLSHCNTDHLQQYSTLVVKYPS